ncbi:MAG: hypothetical protein KJ726_01980, partial [Verrucomicrobia bacterium]|nr:hypothetical protein [Verrucomicrobiota bacterium]
MLVTPQSTKSFARREAGGKGFNLYRMSRLELPVPEWVVLGRGVFDRFASGGLREQIEDVLEKFAPGEAATRIEKLILEAPLPPDISEEAA